MSELVFVGLFAMLVLTAIAAIRLTDLFAVVIMFSVYSLLAASLFVAMDAVDVAFTEAAVGAGVSTILMLATLVLTDRWEKPRKNKALLPLVVVSITGAVLLYGTLDMPDLGDQNAPIHQHVAKRYLSDSGQEIGVPNVVTSILASYRGYDTFGELIVIFTAGVGVMSLLGGRRKKKKVENNDT